METPNPDQDKPKKYKAITPLPEEMGSSAKISLVRKIIIGLFIVGYWVFYYWFQEP